MSVNTVAQRAAAAGTVGAPLRLDALGRAAAYVGRLLATFIVASVVIGVPLFVQRGVASYVHPTRSLPSQTPADVGLTYSDVILQTRDGLHLAAWSVPGRRSDALILIHGIGNNRDSLLPLARQLNARGYNLLLLELRAHGQSEGDTSTLGVREVEDVRAALLFLQQQPGVDPQRIGVWGMSLGSSVALLSAAALPELHAVAVDSVFASARWLIEHQLGALIAVPDWFGPAVLALGGWEAGVSPDAIAPVEAARQLGSRPLFVIQGEQDALFFPENARMVIAAASGPAELWMQPGAAHTGTYELDPPAYVSRLDTFFSTALGGRTSE
jgi:dipeptidyl aminopeptidase/acylaminoacyl peptidase